jgi:hypothetical protein
LRETKATKIISSRKKSSDQLSLKIKKAWGDVIEDRGSQITLLAEDIEYADSTGRVATAISHPEARRQL